MARKVGGCSSRVLPGRRPARPISPELLALGQRIHSLRKKRGLIGADTGINPTSLSFIERGRQDVSFSQLVKLAARFEMTVAGLVTLPRTPKS